MKMRYNGGSKMKMKESLMDIPPISFLSKVWISGMIMIFSPLLFAFIAMFLLKDGFAKKCKYHKVCPDCSDSALCMRDGGEYYVSLFEARPSKCYLKMAGLKDR